MDWNTVGVSIGNGLSIGAGVLGAVNLIGLPVSYIANRFVYHSTPMRIILTLVAIPLSIFLLIGMLIYQAVTLGTGIAKVHYFGYLPFVPKRAENAPVTGNETGPTEMGWIEPLLAPVWRWIRDVLFGGFVLHLDEQADRAAIERMIEVGAKLVPLTKKGTPGLVILEEAVALAQQAARAPTREDALELEARQRALLTPPQELPPQSQPVNLVVSRPLPPPSPSPPPPATEDQTPPQDESSLLPISDLEVSDLNQTQEGQ